MLWTTVRLKKKQCYSHFWHQLCYSVVSTSRRRHLPFGIVIQPSSSETSQCFSTKEASFIVPGKLVWSAVYIIVISTIILGKWIIGNQTLWCRRFGYLNRSWFANMKDQLIDNCTLWGRKFMGLSVCAGYYLQILQEPHSMTRLQKPNNEAATANHNRNTNGTSITHKRRLK